MNYRHFYHAGNFADVVKHAVLASVLTYLGRKEAPFRVIDTHAGIGLYDLAREEAGKTGEWREGIGRLFAADLPPVLTEVLTPYLGLIEALNPDGVLRLYPGSPLIAARLGRGQDRFIFNELHEEDREALNHFFARDKRVRLLRLDGYMLPKSTLPPPERRGIMLIDPPFEAPGEFGRLAEAFQNAARRFATGTLIAWYPLKDLAAVNCFHAHLAASSLPPLLAIELWTRQIAPERPLAGAGLVIMNPTFRLDEDFGGIIEELAALLSHGAGAGGRVFWLKP